MVFVAFLLAAPPSGSQLAAFEIHVARPRVIPIDIVRRSIHFVKPALLRCKPPRAGGQRVVAIGAKLLKPGLA